MLQNILQCTGQHPTTIIQPSKDVNCIKAENPWIKVFKLKDCISDISFFG